MAIEIMTTNTSGFEWTESGLQLLERLKTIALKNGGYQRYAEGIEFEPLHRSEISKFAGVDFLEAGWLQCEENSLLGISPDGITEDGKISWEGKSPGSKKHISTVYSRQIPADNIHQCLHYFTVNPLLETHYFSSFRPESKYPLWVKKLTRDSLIDLGTKAKPNVKKVAEWVEVALKEANQLEENLNTALINMDKI